MAQRRIDKQVVACFLESTKEVLEHISRWTVEINARGQELPRGVTKTYGSARRLRDYLQRSLSAFPQPVLIDLSDDDENLLVSCFLHSVGTLDGVLAKGVRTTDEKTLLEQKRKALADWALELTTRLPERIPTSGKVELNTPTVRTILAAAARKVAALQDPAITPTGFSAATPQGAAGALAGVAPSFGGGDEAAPSQDPPRLKIQTFHSGLQSIGGPSGSTAQPAGDIGIPTSPDLPGAEAQGTKPTAVRSPEPSRVLDAVVDVQRFRDPRLRTMVGLDLRAFERAWQANDSRLAMVHLYSIFEAGVLDHALGRRTELGLQSNVESWSIEGILQRALGDRLLVADRAQLIGLISGRSLVRPAIQLTSPLAVTQTSLRAAIELARRIFVELGLTGSGPSEAPPTPPLSPASTAPAAAPEAPAAASVGSIGKTPGVWSGIWGVAAP